MDRTAPTRGGDRTGPRPERLTRSRDHRVIAGVCAGAAKTLGVEPLVLRVATVVLTLAGGMGVAVYATAWLLLPREGEEESPAQAMVRHRRWDLGEVGAVAAIALGLLLLVRATGVWFSDAVVWPLLLAGVGLAVIWRQAATDARRPGLVATEVPARRSALARMAVGIALVVSGVAAFLAASDAFSALRQGVLATAAIAAGLALVTGPWWLRLGRDLARERGQRIRSEERAEVAAHLHDSVLQTLALIQRNAEDPRTVVTMARRQERELRGWLYETGRVADDRVQATQAGHNVEGGLAGDARGESLAGEVARVAAEVEGLHGVAIEVVTVGDTRLDEDLRALVAAAREAMVNAARWSGAKTVSVYTEVGEAEVVVFVRDWGSGFDLASVAPDRHGVRESIAGRMTRHGGSATVRTAPGDGTEVELRLGRERR